MINLNSCLSKKAARKLLLSEVCLDLLTPTGIQYRYRAFIDGVLVIDRVGTGLEFRKECVERIVHLVRQQDVAGNVNGIWCEGYLAATSKAASEVCRRVVMLQTIGSYHRSIEGVSGICRYMSLERFYREAQEGVKE